jgi:hypothetical protein
MLLLLIFFVLALHTHAYTCPNVCSGHGKCESHQTIMDPVSGAAIESAGKCVCDTGYGQPDCSTFACPTGTAWFTSVTSDNTRASVNVECSGIGICDHTTFQTKEGTVIFAGTCICPSYATGKSFTRVENIF